MGDNIKNNRHKTGRKLAKKLRRKKIRQKLAQLRDAKIAKEKAENLKNPKYLTLLAEQQLAELEREEWEQEERYRIHEQWLKADLKCQQNFLEQQRKLNEIERIKEEKRLKIQLEFEAEQRRVQEIKDEKQRKIDEQKRQYELLMNKIDDYINGVGNIPDELLIKHETEPGLEQCTFFIKTGACRYGDKCSRNHINRGCSEIILLPNFFFHIHLEQQKTTEYGNDFQLEFDDKELYNDFYQFFIDIDPEFCKFGRIKQLVVCRNQEQHLRGNVYVEYESRRSSLKAYRNLHGRYYGGRIIAVQFCSIQSWKTAICGLSFSRICPKGRSCNFLHIFKNPMNKYSILNALQRKTPSSTRTTTTQYYELNADNCKNSWNDDNDKLQKKNWKWSSSDDSNSSEDDTSKKGGDRKYQRRYQQNVQSRNHDTSYKFNYGDRRSRRCGSIETREHRRRDLDNESRHGYSNRSNREHSINSSSSVRSRHKYKHEKDNYEYKKSKKHKEHKRKSSSRKSSTRKSSTGKHERKSSRNRSKGSR